jgi:type I restriction enzyme S subunit
LIAQVYSRAVRRRIDSLTGGTTNPHLNVDEVRNFPIPAPPIDEQWEIVGTLAAHDGITAREEGLLTKTHLLKSGLMSDLLTGRVRVPENINLEAGVAP